MAGVVDDVAATGVEDLVVLELLVVHETHSTAALLVVVGLGTADEVVVAEGVVCHCPQFTLLLLLLLLGAPGPCQLFHPCGAAMAMGRTAAAASTADRDRECIVNDEIDLMSWECP